MRNVPTDGPHCRSGTTVSINALTSTIAAAALAILSACGSESSSIGDSMTSGDKGSGQSETAVAETSKDMATSRLVASLPDPFNTADFENGKSKYNQCIACHALEDGKNGLGPHLHDIMSRSAGSVQEFKYSDALRNSELIWDAATLDKWIENPAKLVPGSTMNYAGLRNAHDRRDLIAYLMAETAKE